MFQPNVMASKLKTLSILLRTYNRRRRRSSEELVESVENKLWQLKDKTKKDAGAAPTVSLSLLPLFSAEMIRRSIN